jgi:eukaryotic-like serine/threonine-protein kinase
MDGGVALHHDHLVLGRYRPLKPLGSGGSGSVWLVRDEQSARNVALKVVALEGKAGSRAEREVEAGTRLRHPRCLRALALARDDGHVYVTYPYVSGTTLREALRRGELDAPGAVEAAAQVLEALGHAHAKGIVHRDVKPANIMLEAAEGVSVRVLDFGLAQLSEAETLTAAGDVPGTLAYIAPERLDGKGATGAADVWSVGVILWEALAGRHPFWAASPLETARLIRAGAAPLASQRPDLPRELCAAVDRMLALEPQRRPRAEPVAGTLRSSLRPRAERSKAEAPRPGLLAVRAAHAGLAGIFTTAATLLLPFFPTGWPFLLGGLAVLAAAASPAAGLALALAAPLLPLGNTSLGLALAYGVLALGWYLLFHRDARSGLLFCLGPLLVPLGAVGLAPALVAQASGTARRAALAGMAVLAAVGVTTLMGWPLPLTGGGAQEALALGGTANPLRATGSVVAFLSAHSALALEALVFAAAAATTGLARTRGLWGIALWGSAFLAAALLAPRGAVGTLPLALGIWGAALLLAVPLLRRPR